MLSEAPFLVDILPSAIMDVVKMRMFYDGIECGLGTVFRDHILSEVDRLEQDAGVDEKLAAEVEKVRKEKGLTQMELARKLGTKQSGVARMINCPGTSSIDNLMKALIAMGTPISRIAASLLLCTAAGN